MAQLTPVKPKRAQNQLAGAAASAGGDTFVNTGKELLVVNHTNPGGASVTLTIATDATVDGEAIDDKTVTIPPGERHLIGPFPTSIYSNNANKTVALSYSDETDIEVAVVKPTS